MTTHRKLIMTTLSVIVASTAVTTLPATAGDDDLTRHSCSWLWFERNQIYKDNGYCFKTARAISAFGNAGCRYGSERSVPLAKWQRGYVKMLKQAERDKGC